MNALASSVTVVSTGGSRSQERVPRSGVLWDWVHNAQPIGTSFANGGVVKKQCSVLQIDRLCGDLEQSFGMGGNSGFGRN